MYIQTTVIDCLKNLVGFRQNDNPDYPTLVPSLLTTETGLYFQDAHPLLTIENIDQCARNFDHYSFPNYAAGSTYSTGQRVRFSGLVYESLVDSNTGNQPDTSPIQWTEVNLLSQFLISMVEAGVNDVAKFLFIDKKIREITKTIFENVLLFTGVGSLADKVIKRDRFVGFAIELKDHNNLQTIINRIGMQFDTVNPAFDLYVFHTSRTDPIATLQFNVTGPNNFSWHTPTTGSIPTLEYHSRDYDVGGLFIIGYYEEDLVGQAIDKEYNFNREPCGSCNRLNLDYYRKWSEFMNITPIEVSSGNIGTKGQLFDINNLGYTYHENFGLNLDLTVRCDISDFICQERTVFTDAVYYSVAKNLIRMIAFNVRENDVSKQVKQEALVELEREFGISTSVKRAMKALSFDFSDLNTACLPCNQQAGVTRTSVWG